MPEGIRGQPLRFSRFHCREMLYDYMNGRLDSERHAAVEAGLKEYPELKNELGAMISAAHYCAELAQIKPRETLTHDFRQIRLKTEIVSEKIKYKNWPDLLRWSSEAIVISIFVAAVGWIIPWGSIQNIFKVEPSNEFVLADLDAKTKSDVVVPPLETKSEEKAPAEQVKPVEVAPVAKVEAPPTEVKTPVPAVVTTTTAPVQTQPKLPVKTPSPAIAEKKAGPKGFLYRIMMNVAGIQQSAPALRDQIIAMGGEKAGQVEIGYRQKNSNYFHFSMPESNYQKLLSTLGAYGPVRIYKGPHERVMPEGVIRIILDIEDAKGKAAPSAESTSKEEATENASSTNENTGSSATPDGAAPSTETPPADDTTSTGQ